MTAARLASGPTSIPTAWSITRSEDTVVCSVTVPSSVAAMSGVPAERVGVASALLNASRQLGGALGLAVISTLVSATTAHAMSAGHAIAATAMTMGFRTGFAASAGLLVVAVAVALILLREDGRGEHLNLIELQTAGA
jgi:hypothetical protein